MNKKIWWVIIIIVVLGLIWWASSKPNLEVEPPSDDAGPVATDTDTTNWKTYRNDEYGFEFKYPPQGWEVTVSKEKSQGVMIDETLYKSYGPISVDGRAAGETGWSDVGPWISKMIVLSRPALSVAFFANAEFSPEEAEVLYKQILSTFRFTE